MVLPLFYFGPVSYFSFILENYKNGLIFEINDNFIKQSYRNRCYILGSNKKLCLTIPIEHKHSTKLLNDTRISYDFDWVKLHLKSLDSAYRSTPYYEFYEESIHLIYNKKEVFLIDFLLNTFHWTVETLTIDLNFNTTNEYKKNHLLDFRNSFNAKHKNDFEETILKNSTEYYQVLANESEFTKNLSILDLLFNCGNTSINYL